MHKISPGVVNVQSFLKGRRFVERHMRFPFPVSILPFNTLT